MKAAFDRSRRRVLYHAVFAIPLLVGVAGCGAAVTSAHDVSRETRPSAPAIVFPAREDLATLPSKTPARDAFAIEATPVELWTFDRPPFASAAAYDDPTPWGDFLRRVVASRSHEVTLSSPLRCAAGEIGRFYLAKGTMPTESLQRFTVARCGGTSTHVVPLVWSGAAEPAMSDDAIFEVGRGKIEPALTRSLASGRRVVGLAFWRERERFVAVTLIGRDDARIEASSLLAGASRSVVVRGTLREPGAGVVAVINQGQFGAAECKRQGQIPLPRFAFTCRLADADTAAWVDVAVHREGRVLLTPVGELLVRTRDAGPLAYRAPSPAPATAVETPGELAAAILDGVNRARARARLAPLSPATRQATENTRLAGTLIDAFFERDDVVGDRIALGLMAGWEVDGLIRKGDFYVARAPARDAGAWIEGVLERPLGRLMFLDPSARQIAVGPTMPDGIPGFGAVVTTYAFFESADHAKEVDRFVERVAAERATRGLPSVTRVLADELTAAAHQVLERGERPTVALDAAMRAIAALGPVRVDGLLLETNDLDGIALPDALLRAEPLKMAVEVTHHRAPGAAWGQLVVFVVVVSPRGDTPRQRASAVVAEIEGNIV